MANAAVCRCRWVTWKVRFPSALPESTTDQPPYTITIHQHLRRGQAWRAPQKACDHEVLARCCGRPNMSCSVVNSETNGHRRLSPSTVTIYDIKSARPVTARAGCSSLMQSVAVAHGMSPSVIGVLVGGKAKVITTWQSAEAQDVPLAADERSLLCRRGRLIIGDGLHLFLECVLCTGRQSICSVSHLVL